MVAKEISAPLRFRRNAAQACDLAEEPLGRTGRVERYLGRGGSIIRGLVFTDARIWRLHSSARGRPAVCRTAVFFITSSATRPGNGRCRSAEWARWRANWSERPVRERGGDVHARHAFERLDVAGKKRSVEV